MSDFFEPGQWNAICDRCGRKFKSGQLRKTWQGFMVCSRDWEPRHPQDFVKGSTDNMSVPWSRPPQAPNFVNWGTPAVPVMPGVPDNGALNNSAIAGIAVAGQAQTGVS